MAETPLFALISTFDWLRTSPRATAGYSRECLLRPQTGRFVHQWTEYWQIGDSPKQVLFEFKIHGQGSLYGDGFAMWLTKQRAQPGNVFGHTDKFEGLGIFFDTYKNNRPGTVFPYIMAMNGDGNTPYDKDNDGKANELAGCSVRKLNTHGYYAV